MLCNAVSRLMPVLNPAAVDSFARRPGGVGVAVVVTVGVRGFIRPNIERPCYNG